MRFPAGVLVVLLALGGATPARAQTPGEPRPLSLRTRSSWLDRGARSWAWHDRR